MIVRLVTEGDFLLPLLLPELAVAMLVHMVILLSCAVAFRQMYFYVVSHFITEKLLPIILGYPVSWGLCALVMVVAYRRMDLEKYALIQKTEVESKEADRSE